jgi:hypothetical protein
MSNIDDDNSNNSIDRNLPAGIVVLRSVIRMIVPRQYQIDLVVDEQIFNLVSHANSNIVLFPIRFIFVQRTMQLHYQPRREGAIHPFQVRSEPLVLVGRGGQVMFRGQHDRVDQSRIVRVPKNAVARIIRHSETLHYRDGTFPARIEPKIAPRRMVTGCSPAWIVLAVLQ